MDNAETPPAPDYWKKSVIRRVDNLCRELESLPAEELEIIRETPEAEKLRLWLRNGLEFDL